MAPSTLTRLLSLFFVLTGLAYILTSCIDSRSESAPIPPQTFEGTIYSQGTYKAFTPCSKSERWYPTRDSLSQPNEAFFDQARKTELDQDTSPYPLTDSLLQAPPQTQKLQTAISLPPFPRALLTPTPDSVQQTQDPIYTRIRGYATDHARFGPYGRYDRVLVVDTILSQTKTGGCGS